VVVVLVALHALVEQGALNDGGSARHASSQRCERRPRR
jgi:hypothetical protein